MLQLSILREITCFIQSFFKIFTLKIVRSVLKPVLENGEKGDTVVVIDLKTKTQEHKLYLTACR